MFYQPTDEAEGTPLTGLELRSLMRQVKNHFALGLYDEAFTMKLFDSYAMIVAAASKRLGKPSYKPSGKALFRQL